mmetsp:Transcript_4609/g.12837  ORF Transcript_4609/g.12837 Transcript_4609/m.12837 type:complete len:133 (+) Transcript_4609:2184-2582(+)
MLHPRQPCCSLSKTSCAKGKALGSYTLLQACCFCCCFYRCSPSLHLCRRGSGPIWSGSGQGKPARCVVPSAARHCGELPAVRKGGSRHSVERRAIAAAPVDDTPQQLIGMMRPPCDPEVWRKAPCVAQAGAA